MNLSSKDERRKVIQDLLNRDTKELNYEIYYHYLKEIDEDYLHHREVWAERLMLVGEDKFPSYNDRIHFLSQDGVWCYVRGEYKAVIMYLTLASEQILKNIYLKFHEHTEEAYKKIEGDENLRGKTLGGIINLFKNDDKLINLLGEKILSIFENINLIRNKSYAHMRFVGVLKKVDDNIFEQYIKYLEELIENFEKIKDFFEEKNLLNLIENRDLDLIYNQVQIEYEIDRIFAEILIKNLQQINKELKISLVDCENHNLKLNLRN